ncbi:MAG: AraC family transcriptional regulator [Sphingobacteriia bacterium]|nr:MAG: AraC family transcriptional regulator [Sphingobacteriia bacterium]
MRPQLLIVPKGPNQSFSVRHDTVPFFFNKWHYHSEIEILYIVQGQGTQFIGDHISRFSDGDILLIGSNLPHYWRCDDNYFQDNPDLIAEGKVVHFIKDFWGENFLLLPENIGLNEIFKKAERGISINGNTREQIKPILDEMLNSVGSMRIILLLKMLYIIASSTELTLLSSASFQNTYNKAETERLNDIYKYTMSNFKQKISLEEIASISCLSVNSFCRYFKSQTKKTYSQFLMEIRIGHSCKLLIENRLSVSAICLESGFNNFSNFNRYFKLITRLSPLEYKKAFAKK